MNKIIASFLGIFFTAVLTVNAQGYKSHKVQVGETVESIAKRYGIEPADIYKFNPEAQKGIYENSVLIIPSKSTKDNVTDSAKESVIFKEHKVKRKETLFGISKEYGVAIEDIKKYNPELYSRELDRKDVIKIPVVVNAPAATQPTTELVKKVDSSKTQQLQPYIVKQSEGVFRVATKHGITVEALKKLNPGMQENLQLGDTLMVPVVKDPMVEQFDFYTVGHAEGFFRIKQNTGYTQEIIEKLNPQVALTGLKEGMILKLPKRQATNTGLASYTKQRVNLVDSIRKREVTLALVMPFKIGELTVDSVPQMVQRLKNDKALNVSLEVYSGVKEAIDSLAALGVNVHLKVLDSQADEYVAEEMVLAGEFKGVDAIVGPLYVKVFNRLAQGVSTDSIPVFAPLSNKNIQNLNNVFSTVPNSDDLTNAVLSYVKARENQYHIFAMADSTNMVAQNRIKAIFPTATLLTDAMLKPSVLNSYFKEDRVNLVFAETNNVPTLTKMTNILSTVVTDSLKVQLVTTNKTAAFDADAVRNEYLNKLNFLYATVDKPSPIELPFAKAYYQTYEKYPSRFAVRAFDLTMDVALRLAQGRSLLAASNEDVETSYVENKFSYQKIPGGLYRNDAIYVVMLKDMEVVEAP